MATRRSHPPEWGVQRPAKRQCLIPRVPDGFNVEPITSRNIAIPKFTSAFSDHNMAVSSASSPKKPPSVGRSKHPSAVSPSKHGSENKPPPTTNKPSSHKRTGNPNVFSILKAKPERRVLKAPSPLKVKPKPQTPLVAVVPPPVPLPANTKPMKPVKPVSAPSFQKPKKATEKQETITISTTKLGRLNHLSSEGGGGELSAMLFREVAPAVHTDPMLDLHMTPEPQGDSHKLVRGGLAAQAIRIFDNAHTSLALWRKEIDHRASPKPDVVVCLEHILVKPLHLSNSHVSSAVALCRVTQQCETGPLSLKREEMYRLVLPFSQLSPDLFESGRIVHIYRPWQKICPSQNDGSCPRLPASLPLPKSPSSTPEPLPTNPTTLLCTRFLLV